jgi:hypothetical protein
MPSRRLPGWWVSEGNFQVARIADRLSVNNPAESVVDGKSFCTAIKQLPHKIALRLGMRMRLTPAFSRQGMTGC